MFFLINLIIFSCAIRGAVALTFLAVLNEEILYCSNYTSYTSKMKCLPKTSHALSRNNLLHACLAGVPNDE